MKKEFTIRHIDDLKKIGFFVENQLKNEEKLTVIVKPFAPNITDAQRGLYFDWMTQIGSELGDSKEYYHDFFKAKFLINIFRRDDSDYEAAVQAVVKTRAAGLVDEADTIARQIRDMTSITNADKTQMSEYMENIKHFAATEMRIAVKQPDDGLI